MAVRDGLLLLASATGSSGTSATKAERIGVFSPQRGLSYVVASSIGDPSAAATGFSSAALTSQNMFAAGGAGLLMRAPFGGDAASWKRIRGPWNDSQITAMAAREDGRVVLCAAGSLFVSEDAGDTWSQAPFGVPIYRLAVADGLFVGVTSSSFSNQATPGTVVSSADGLEWAVSDNTHVPYGPIYSPSAGLIRTVGIIQGMTQYSTGNYDANTEFYVPLRMSPLGRVYVRAK